MFSGGTFCWSEVTGLKVALVAAAPADVTFVLKELHRCVVVWRSHVQVLLIYCISALVGWVVVVIFCVAHATSIGKLLRPLPSQLLRFLIISLVTIIHIFNIIVVSIPGHITNIPVSMAFRRLTISPLAFLFWICFGELDPELLMFWRI